MPSYDPNIKWPEGIEWSKDPNWKWEGVVVDANKEMQFWKVQVDYWKVKYEKAIKAYENLFPVGEPAGRVVMLLWDGKTWIRVPEGSQIQKLEFLTPEPWIEKATEQVNKFIAPAEPVSKPKQPKVERTRRNNVVT